MANAVIGSLRVNLGLDSANFQTGLKSSQKDLDAFAKKIAVGAAAVTAAATAMATALAVSIKRTIDQADELSKAAQKFGVATDELSKLKYAADLSGVSLESLGKGIQRLSRNVVDASAGLKTPQAAFEALGVSIKNADGSLRSSTDIMAQVADRFAAMEDGTAKTAAALMLFGRAGGDLIPLLNGGAAGIKELTDEAERLGLVIDSQTGRAAEAFNDNLTRLQRTWDGVVTKITANLVPSLELLSEQFLKVASNAGFIETASSGVINALSWVANEVAQLAILGSRLNVELAGLMEAFSRLNNYDFSGAWQAFQDGQNASAEMAAKIKADIEGIFDGTNVSQGGIQRRIDDAFGDVGTSAGQNFVAKFAEASSSAGAAETLAARMQEGALALQMSLMTEAEMERASYAERLIALEDFYNAGLLIDADYHEMRERLQEEHSARMAEIAADQEARQRDAQYQALGDLSATMANIGRVLESQGSRNMEISKAFGIASALINTYVGASQVLSDPTLTTFAKFAGVAAVISSGLAQVASIRSVSKGGGGGQRVSTGSMVNGGENGGGASPQQAISITLNGEMQSTQSVYDLLEQINDATADGHKLVIRRA